MCSTGFVKRMLPFFATFAVGLFIASFFVSITGPNFRTRGWERHKQNERLRAENEQLRNENLRLKNQLDNQSMTLDEMPRISHQEFKGHGPELPVLDVPMPPLQPRHSR